MKSLLFVACLILGLASAAQTTRLNDPNAKTRTLNASFNKISVSSGVELYLTQGNENALAVSVSDEKYNDRFMTVVENGTLKIYYDHKKDEWKNSKGRKLKAYVSYKTLEGITCSAGSSTKLTNTLTTGNLSLNFNSGALFAGEIKAADITSNANSGASATVKGSANKLTINVSSGAIFKGSELTTSVCNATASSGGTLKIDVQKELNASANSGGLVSYTGAASLSKGNINSGGSVKKAS